MMRPRPGPEARETAMTLVRHRARGAALSGFPGQLPISLDDAYAIQFAASEAWKRPIAGWKVGLVTHDLAKQFGENRFIGPIFADTVVRSAPADVADFAAIPGGTALAEAEIVALVERTVDGRYQTSCWHLGIEIAGSPISDIGKLGSLATIAAFGNNIGLILGPQVVIADPINVSCSLEIDSTEAGSDTGARLPGGPCAAVDFAIAKLAHLGVSPGDSFYISTGALTGMHPVAVGQEIAAAFKPGGTVRAKVVALA